MNKITLIAMLLLVAGCDALTHPKPIGIKTTMPGPPEYTKGWEDGCTTGMGTMANSYYQSMYHFTQDPTMTTNQLYYQAWKDAYIYCRQYVLKWTFGTIDAPTEGDPNQ